jgi:peptidoglycan/LPS O-acetylase OafA/YrhL
MSDPDKAQECRPEGNLDLVVSREALDAARPVSPLASVSKNPVQRIDELDGLRAFSVLAVIWMHLTLFSQTFPRVLLPLHVIGYLGGFGVEVFFVISGYIITRLMLREQEKYGRFSASGFYIRRAFRILPAYWLYLLSVLVLSRLGIIALETANLRYCFLFLTDTHFYHLSDQAWFYNHTWSLCVEEQFYLVFPLLALLVSRKGRAIVGVLLVTFYVLSASAPDVTTFLKRHYGFPEFQFALNFRFIVVGVALGLFWSEFEPRYRSKVGRIGIWLVIAILCFFQIPIPHFQRVDHYGALWLEPLAVAFGVGWIVAYRGRLSLLRNPAIVWMGRCSYGMYLWQQLFTGLPFLYLGVGQPNALVALFGTIACAGLSFHFVEQPLTSLGRKLAQARSRRRKKSLSPGVPEKCSAVTKNVWFQKLRRGKLP